MLKLGEDDRWSVNIIEIWVNFFTLYLNLKYKNFIFFFYFY